MALQRRVTPNLGEEVGVALEGGGTYDVRGVALPIMDVGVALSYGAVL